MEMAIGSWRSLDNPGIRCVWAGESDVELVFDLLMLENPSETQITCKITSKPLFSQEQSLIARFEIEFNTIPGVHFSIRELDRIAASTGPKSHWAAWIHFERWFGLRTAHEFDQKRRSANVDLLKTAQFDSDPRSPRLWDIRDHWCDCAKNWIRALWVLENGEKK